MAGQPESAGISLLEASEARGAAVNASAPPDAGFETPTLGDDRAEDGEHDLLVER